MYVKSISQGLVYCRKFNLSLPDPFIVSKHKNLCQFKNIYYCFS